MVSILTETLQSRLCAAMERYSNNIAVEYGDSLVSYKELDTKSNAIANYIGFLKMPKGSLIGILMENYVEAVTTMLGILKAGCVFVPLDTLYPMKRLAAMIETTRLSQIFTDEGTVELAEQLNSITGGIHLSCFPTAYAESDPSFMKPQAAYGTEDRGYVFFTSGSTGTPKAIAGKNKSLLHFINWEINEFGINDTFRISHLTSHSFDACLRDIFVPLCAGSTICIPRDRKIIMDAAAFTDWIAQSRLSLIHCTPSLFRHMELKRLTYESYPHLQYILMAGERIQMAHLAEWYRTFGDRIQLVNMYGPSETTMIKLFYRIRPEDAHTGQIPAGVPMKGAKAILLDKDRNVVSQGDVGEIYIRTPYMTEGYLNQPELNKHSFVMNPFSGDERDIIYKTGDLGRMRPDGNILVLGRIDQQVKIRGVRIELSEIECELVKFADIREAAARSYKDSEGIDEFIAAYYAADEEIPHNGLRAFLLQALPEYMIPVYFIRMDKLPVTLNGKLDMNALPHPRSLLKQEFVPPSDEIESKLADIWCSILGLSEVGIHDNFMQIGGNSLHIMTLISAMYDHFEIELPLGVIFENPTIKKLKEYIADRKAESPRLPVIEPLSWPQEYFEIRQKNLTSMFSVALDADLLAALRASANKTRVTVGEFVLSCYAYLLSELSGSKRVPVHALLQEECLLFDFKLDHLEKFEELVAMAATQRAPQELFRLQDLNGQVQAKGNYEILPLFGIEAYVPSAGSGLPAIYDIVMIFDEDDERADLKCIYSNRLKEAAMEELLTGYIRIMELAVQEFGL